MPIFTTPGIRRGHQQPVLHTHKRKRGSRKENHEHEPATQNVGSTHSHDPEDLDLEYTAVLTPDERSQRRLAGQPLDTEPPPYPFPHVSQSRFEKKDDSTIDETSLRITPLEVERQPALHAQHLAAMTAVLHRCLLQGDYHRAGRALGLLLRQQVGGHYADIRHAGMWEIGAEVLLRDARLEPRSPLISNGSQKTLSKGFGRVKTYFETLAVQYPPHKAWPDAVNALDFNLAAFELWIFVTVQESQNMFEKSQPSSPQDESVEEVPLYVQARQWELGEAEEIGRRMDEKMTTVPFSDDLELVRLRAMVALWIADLSDDLQHTAEESLFSPAVDESAFASHGQSLPLSSKSQAARRLAEDLFSKLSGGLSDQDSSE